MIDILGSVVDMNNNGKYVMDYEDEANGQVHVHAHRALHRARRSGEIAVLRMITAW